MALSKKLVEELQAIILKEEGFEMPTVHAERAAAFLVAYADGLAEASHNPTQRGNKRIP